MLSLSSLHYPTKIFSIVIIPYLLCKNLHRNIEKHGQWDNRSKTTLKQRYKAICYIYYLGTMAGQPRTIELHLVPTVLYTRKHILIAHTRFDIKASKIVKSQTICVMLFVIDLSRIQKIKSF